MSRSILAIDIGNTTIGLAVMSRHRAVKIYRLDTQLDGQALRQKLSAILKRIDLRYSIENVVICSVVPEKLKIIIRLVRDTLKKRPFVIGRDIKVPIKNLYRNPRQVGQDRLVGAYAALKYYGTPVIIIDLGTAITFDVVSRKGEYMGGIIVPGIRLSAESLFNKTALLPKIKIKKPKALIGKDTEGSILSGLFYGYGALSRGLIERISRTLKGKTKVIITGGHTRLIKDFILCKINAVDQDLVFKGIDLVFRNR